MEDEFVSLGLTIAVMEKYSYRPIEIAPAEQGAVEGLIFENFKKPFRKGLKYISFQSPNVTGPDGEAGYNVWKLAHTISCMNGISYIGEVIATIKLTRKELHDD